MRILVVNGDYTADEGIPVDLFSTHNHEKVHVVKMTHPRIMRLVWPVAMLMLGAVCDLTLGQTQRTRTLTYDQTRKSWIEQPPPQPGTAEGDLFEIRQQVKAGEYGPALSACQQFLNQYEDDEVAQAGGLIIQAEALIGQRAFFQAHQTLQTFLARFGGGSLTVEALRLEHVIAETYLTGVKRKLFGLRLISGEELAFDILDEITNDYPDLRIAELALKTKADYLFLNGDHSLAEIEYEELNRRFPRSRYHQHALRRSAESALASFGGVPYDGAALIESEERYREYRQRYPQEAAREGVDLVLDRIRELRAEKDFSIGQYYERTDHLTSAIYYYQLVGDDWPDTIAAAQALRRLELLGQRDSVSQMNDVYPSLADAIATTKRQPSIEKNHAQD